MRSFRFRLGTFAALQSDNYLSLAPIGANFHMAHLAVSRRNRGMRFAFALCAIAFCAAVRTDDGDEVMTFMNAYQAKDIYGEELKVTTSFIDFVATTIELSDSSRALAYIASKTFCSSTAESTEFHVSKKILGIVHHKWPSALYQVQRSDSNNAFFTLCDCPHSVNDILDPTANILNTFDAQTLFALPKLTLKLIIDNGESRLQKMAEYRYTERQRKALDIFTSFDYQPFITAGLLVDAVYSKSAHVDKLVSLASDNTKALALMALQPYQSVNKLPCKFESNRIYSVHEFTSLVLLAAKTANSCSGCHPLEILSRAYSNADTAQCNAVDTTFNLIGFDGTWTVFDRIIAQQFQLPKPTLEYIFRLYRNITSINFLTKVSVNSTLHSFFDLVSNSISNVDNDNFNFDLFAISNRYSSKDSNAAKYFYAAAKFAQYVKQAKPKDGPLQLSIDKLHASYPDIANCIGREYAAGKADRDDIQSYAFPCHCFSSKILDYTSFETYVMFGQIKCIDKFDQSSIQERRANVDVRNIKSKVLWFYVICYDWLRASQMSKAHLTNLNLALSNIFSISVDSIQLKEVDTNGQTYVDALYNAYFTDRTLKSYMRLAKLISQEISASNDFDRDFKTTSTPILIGNGSIIKPSKLPVKTHIDGPESLSDETDVGIVIRSAVTPWYWRFVIAILVFAVLTGFFFALRRVLVRNRESHGIEEPALASNNSDPDDNAGSTAKDLANRKDSGDGSIKV